MLLFRVFLLTALSLTLPASTAWASGGFYIETGAGTGMFFVGSAYFNNGATDNSSLGGSLNVILAKSFSPDDATFQFHFGIRNQFDVTTSNDALLMTHTILPVIRFEFWRFYFGGGGTPFVFANADGGAFQIQERSIGLLGEAGVMWKVTPDFYFNIGATAHSIYRDGLLRPIIGAGTIQLRFYFSHGDPASSGGSSGKKYDGWRYPFGIEIR